MLISQRPMPNELPSIQFGTSISLSNRSDSILKAGIVSVFLSDTVFSRFGINIGNSFFLDFSLIALYILLACILFSGYFRIDRRSAILYGASVCFGSISYLFNIGNSSISSLLLLFAVYFPFIITVPNKIPSETLWKWAAEAFSNIALFCAIAGIVQFFAQTVIHDKWLFDFRYLLPDIIRLESGFNTIIPMGTLFKSNGFFIREPSGFSELMAFALVFELALRRRGMRIMTYGLGLLLSYSGSGILIILIAFLFPLNYKSVFRYLFLSGAAGLILWLLGDALNLWFIVDRASEFNSEQSSAYARFIAPFRLLVDTLTTDPWNPFLGHGPGMISRTVLSYGFHDPTYVKLLFEYGACGAIVMIANVAFACTRSTAPVRIKAMFFFTWLIFGGGLLTTGGTTSLMYVFLAIWPLSRPTMQSAEMTGKL